MDFTIVGYVAHNPQTGMYYKYSYGGSKHVDTVCCASVRAQMATAVADACYETTIGEPDWGVFVVVKNQYGGDAIWPLSDVSAEDDAYARQAVAEELQRARDHLSGKTRHDQEKAAAKAAEAEMKAAKALFHKLMKN